MALLFEWKRQADLTSTQQLTKASEIQQPVNGEVHQQWCHETTNDEDYVPRQAQLDTLDAWSDDKATKVIAATGIGGQGKTSLVGYWAKQGNALSLRNYDGLFYWSFYNEPTVSVFLDSLLATVSSVMVVGTGRIDWGQPLHSLRHIMKETNLLMTLDGLEMLQNSPGHPPYGQFIESDLRHFLCDVCASSGGSIAVLTSRFDVVDLRHYGKRFKSMPLGHLTDEEGCRLLEQSLGEIRKTFIGLITR